MCHPVSGWTGQPKITSKKTMFTYLVSFCRSGLPRLWMKNGSQRSVPALISKPNNTTRYKTNFLQNRPKKPRQNVLEQLPIYRLCGWPRKSWFVVGSILSKWRLLLYIQGLLNLLQKSNGPSARSGQTNIITLAPLKKRYKVYFKQFLYDKEVLINSLKIHNRPTKTVK